MPVTNTNAEETSSLSLARKYRPFRFSDVCQPVTSRVLSAQIKMGKLAQAHLFAGPSGTGKTTLARIVAMALSCTGRDPKEIGSPADPCGVCRNCQQIRDGVFRDMIEIDCGKDGGVEAARDLVTNQLRVPPILGDFRTITLDEAHLLSKAAQVALLKAIEEPPPYVRFFLCTTERNKIDSAIQTRCQNHYLTSVSADDIYNVLTDVVKGEAIKAVQPEALRMIAKASGGSVRRALNDLEAVIPIGVTVDVVQDTLQRAPRSVAVGFISAIAHLQHDAALRAVKTVMADGRDVSSFLEEAALMTQELTIWRLLKTPPQERAPDLSDLTDAFTGTELIAITTALIEIIKQIRQNVAAELAVPSGVIALMIRFADARASRE